ncbi:MAG: IclR family transcriptional regulator [Chloroflexi bacterium]|nr:IclR family transcriptional regulator [Chloroflexota bacterium]
MSNRTVDRSTAPAVAKASRILDVVARSPGLGVSEIARRAELSKSTAHGLIGALVGQDLLTLAAEGRGYTLGPRLIELGARAGDQRLLAVAEPHLLGLARSTGETVLFGRLAGDRVLILAAHQSERLLTLSAPAGSSVPLLAGALGKAYLAAMARDMAAAYLERTSLPRYTDRSITDREVYLAETRRVAEQGYAMERGEYLRGIAAVAASFAWLGATYFIWSVGIEANHGDADLHRLGGQVAAATGAIARQLDDRGRSAAARSAS